MERLTAKQRRTVFDAFGPAAHMQLYKRGIRQRLAPMLDGDRRRLELAYSLILTLPGTPVFRYGDEIGMGDNLDLQERNSARTPMQWSTEPHAGFTKAYHSILPVIDHGPYGYQHVNVADQRRDSNSLLNWTERAVRMRKEVPEIGLGDFVGLPTGSIDVFALRYDWVITLSSFFIISAGRRARLASRPAPNDPPTSCWSICFRAITAERIVAASMWS